MSLYITTAISYTNGSPHIGHSYEILCADVISRFHKLNGVNVFLSTGTDEHGQKIANTADKLKITPIDVCNKYAGEFKMLNNLLNINADRFIRTTDPSHHIVAKNAWLMASDDIYLGTYTGWYMFREERYVTETEASILNYCDPVSGNPLTKHCEPSYFFRLSKYQDRIIDHISSNPDFIHPSSEDILARLKEPLSDISISRLKEITGWGIPIDNTDHVMYVWFDALTNYLTEYWPANIQIIGKDIVWFHSVIWLGMLMSMKLPLPKTILVHGFITGTDGRKMSKSIGNVIDPNYLIEKYGSDVVRSYLTTITNIGADPIVTEENLISFHDGIICLKFSNLVHRILVLINKINNGIIPEAHSVELFSIKTLNVRIFETINKYQLKSTFTIIFEYIDIINKYLTDSKVWVNHDNQVIYTILNAIYIVSHYLHPFIPNNIDKLCKFLDIKLKDVNSLTWNNFTSGHQLKQHKILFKRLTKSRYDRNN